MNRVEREKFFVIGISARTNNNTTAPVDMGKLWGDFMSNNLQQAIPNKCSEEVYSIYTEYESDYTGDYTAILGCRVSSLEHIPEGMIGKEIEAGSFIEYEVKGEMPQAVVSQWEAIWAEDKKLNRAYTSDYEVYAKQGVKIFIAIK